MSTPDPKEKLQADLAAVQALLEGFKTDKGGFTFQFVRQQEQDHAILLHKVRVGETALKAAWSEDGGIRNRVGNAHIVIMNAQREGLITQPEYDAMRVLLNQLSTGVEKIKSVNSPVWDFELREAGNAAPAPVGAA